MSNPVLGPTPTRAPEPRYSPWMASTDGLENWRYPNVYIQFPPPSISASAWAGCGVAASIASSLAYHPLDTLKTRMQCTWFDGMPQYSSSIECMRNTNWSALWRGVLTSSIAPLQWGWRFAAQEIGCAMMLEGKHPLRRVKTRERFFVGYISGAIEAFLNCPVELVRIRAQMAGQGGPLMQPRVYNGSIVAHLLRHERMETLFKGLSVTMMRDGLFCGAFFATFHGARYAWFSRRFGKESQEPLHPPLSVSVSAAAIGGAVAAIISHPFDMLKTRRQHVSYWKRPSIQQSYELLNAGELGAWKRVRAIRNQNAQLGSAKGTVLSAYYLMYGRGEGSGLPFRIVGKAFAASLLVGIFEISMGIFLPETKDA